jgi:hypothetical protein
MSRSSSVSTKDRAVQNKRPKATKQRRDDSENFDVRSQYTPFFPQPQVPTWVSAPQYSPVVTQQYGAGASPNSYQNPGPTPFVPPAQQFNQPMMTNGASQAYNNMPQVNVCQCSVRGPCTYIISSNIPSNLHNVSSHIAHLSLHMAHLFNHQLHPNIGRLHLCIQHNINHKELL